MAIPPKRPFPGRQEPPPEPAEALPEEIVEEIPEALPEGEEGSEGDPEGAGEAVPAAAPAPARKGAGLSPKGKHLLAAVPAKKRFPWGWVILGVVVVLLGTGYYFLQKSWRDDNLRLLQEARNLVKARRWNDAKMKLLELGDYGIEPGEPVRMWRYAEASIRLDAAKGSHAGRNPGGYVEAVKSYQGALEWAPNGSAQRLVPNPPWVPDADKNAKPANPIQSFEVVEQSLEDKRVEANGGVDRVRADWQEDVEKLAREKKWNEAIGAAPQMQEQYPDVVRLDQILREAHYELGEGGRLKMDWAGAIPSYREARAAIVRIYEKGEVPPATALEGDVRLAHVEREEENFRRFRDRAERFVRHGGHKEATAFAEAATAIQPGSPIGKALKDWVAGFRGMRFIPGAPEFDVPFVVGSAGSRDTRPEQPMSIPSFYIDPYETTNADYRRGGGEPPIVWESFHGGPGLAIREDFSWKEHYCYPAAGVSFEQAERHARALGKRLPTEFEWEKACRGLSGRIYPWGNERKPARDREVSSNLFPTGYYWPGKSPFGVYDMVGNVREWTDSWYNPYPGDEDPTPPPGNPWGDDRVLRGGAYISGGAFTTSFYRLPRRPADRQEEFGIRCAKSTAAPRSGGAASAELPASAAPAPSPEPPKAGPGPGPGAEAPKPPARLERCIPCEGKGKNPDGSACQLCNGTGKIAVGPDR